MENKTEQQQDNVLEHDDDVIVIEESKDKNTPNHKLIWGLLFILVGASLSLFWLFNQQKLAHDELQQQLLSLESTLLDESKVTLMLSELEVSTEQQMTSLSVAQDKLNNDLTLLMNSQDNQAVSNADVQYYWALAEVEYLLNIANQQALFSADVTGAHRALTMADERVEGLDDYRLHPLRSLIAKEQLALKAVANVDIEGMALQLQSALKQVDSLQVLMGPSLTEQAAVKGGTEQEVADWQVALEQAWQEVKSLVVIRHQQDGTAAVLVPEQRYFLYQNLRLKLETARFALLSGKSSVFQTSLHSAEQWLETYFVGEERDAMLASIQGLQTVSTEVAIPDISGSLLWLKGFEQ